MFESGAIVLDVAMRAGRCIGAEGTVLLKILVGTDGTPLEVVVQKGSGNRSLDRAAREHVLAKWRFKPAMSNGQAVQAYGLVPVVFSMQ